MANAITYIKNVGKSVGYVSFDVVKKMNPVFSDFAETNGELATDMYKSIRDIKKNAKDAPNKIMNSKYGQFAKTYLVNLKSDLKTGKFYNRERIDEAEAKAFGFDDADFDFGFDDDLDSFGISSGDDSDFFDEGPSTNEMIDIVGEKTSNAISNTMARSAEYIVQSTTESNRAIYNQMNSIYGGIHSGLSTINQNIAKILEFSNENVISHFENSRTFYTEITRMDQERNNYLKEILENVKKISDPPQAETRSSSRLKYSDIVSFDGVLDISKYKENIKKNLSDYMGMFSMVDMLFDKEFSHEFTSSPVSGLLKLALTGLVPGNVKKATDKLNQSFSGLFGNALMKLKGKSNDLGVWSTIAEIFGINTSIKTKLDTSQYEKGKIPFDGITKKSIVEVIPTYLSKILAALNGKPETRYNYEDGKFVTVKELKEQFGNMTKDSANRAAYDLDTVIRTKKKNLSFRDEKEQKQFEEDWEALKLYLFKNQKSFNTRDKSLTGKSFGLKGGMASDINVKLFQELLDGTSENTRYAHELFKEIDDHNRRMRELENSSAMSSIFNGSVEGEAGSAFAYSSDNKGAASNKKKDRKEKRRKRYSKQRDKVYDKTQDKIRSQAGLDDDIDKDSEVARIMGSIKDEDDFVKDPRSFSEKMNAASGLSAKMAVLAQSASELAKKPAKFIVSLMDKADERLYDLIYGPKEDKHGRKSFVGRMFGGLEKMFDKFSTFLDETFIEPMKKIFTKENMQNVAKKVFGAFGINIGELFNDARVYLFGKKDADGNRVKEGLFTNFFKDFKDGFKSIFGWMKDSVKGVGEWTGTTSKKNQKGQAKQSRNDTRRDYVNFLSNLLPKSTSDITEAASGIRRVNEDAELVVVSKGEAIIPASLNPFDIAKRSRDEKRFKNKLKSSIDSIPAFAEGTPNVGSDEKFSNEDKDTNFIKQAMKNPKVFYKWIEKKTSGMSDKEKDSFLKKLMSKSSKESFDKDDYEEGRNPFFDRILHEFGKMVQSVRNVTDTFGMSDEDVETFKGNAMKFINGIKEHGGTIAAGATIGAGVSILTGLVGGPLVGAAVGAGTALIKKSETVQKMLFGDIDENGDRKGGLISKDLSNNIRKYLPDMAKGGTIGTIISALPLVPGGPIAGLMIGSALGFAKNNEKAQEFLFGFDGLNLDKEAIQKKVKSVLPKMGAGALAGLIAGPFGLGANILLGSALGFASDTNTFKDVIFGEEVDGKRTGGIFGAITKPAAEFFKKSFDEFKVFLKDDIMAPVKNALPAFMEDFRLLTEKFSKTASDFFREKIGQPIENFIKNNIINPIGGFIKKTLGFLAKPFKALISAPFKAIGQYGDLRRRRHIKDGNARYMGAAQRNAFRKSKGAAYMGRDDFAQFDQALENVSDSDLDVMKTAFSAINDVRSGYTDLSNNAFKRLRKEIYSDKHGVKPHIAKAALDMVRKGQYAEAIEFVRKADIEETAKTSIIAKLSAESARMKMAKEMRENSSKGLSRVAELGKEMGFEIDIEKLKSDPEYARTILKNLESEGKYRDKYQKKTPMDELNDDQKKRHDEIVDIISDIRDAIVKGKDYKEKDSKGNEVKDGFTQDSKKSRLELFHEQLGDVASGERTAEDINIENGEDLNKYNLRGMVSQARSRARKSINATKQNISTTKAGASNYFKNLKREITENETFVDIFGDKNKRYYGDPDIDNRSFNEKMGADLRKYYRESKKSKVGPINDEATESGKMTKSEQQALKERIALRSGGKIISNLNNKASAGDDKAAEAADKTAKIIAAMAAKEGIDLKRINYDKELGSEITRITQNHKKKKSVQFLNGRPVVYTTDKDGNPIVDASNAENEETFAIEDEKNNTQKGILAGLTAIPHALGNVLGNIFGNKDEEKESIFEKIFGFFTGKGDINLFSVLKSSIPLLVTALGLSGKFDNLISAITGGAFGKKDSNNAQTVKDANGNNVEIQVDKDGNPILDENGNYITVSGESISGDSYRNKTSALATMSASDRLKYNLVRGTISGKGSIVGSVFKANKLVKGVSSTINKASGKVAKKTGLGTLIKAATDKGAMDDIINSLLDNTDTFIKALKHVPILKKYVNEDALINLSVGLGDLIERYLPKIGANATKLTKSISKLALPIAITMAISDFSTGWQDASTILKIRPEDVETHHKIICGLVRTFKNLIPIAGTFIPDSAITDLFINHVAKWFGMDVSAIKNKQAAAQSEMEAAGYTSWAEYNKKVNGQYTWTEKIRNGISSAISNIKEKGLVGATASAVKSSNVGRWVSNTWDKAKEFGSNVKDKAIDFVTPAVNAVKEKIGTIKDIGSYAVNVVRDTWDEMISGESKESDNLVIDENDPYASHKKIIYNLVKILAIVPSGVIKVGKLVWDKVKAIGSGIATIGNGLAQSVQNQFTNAWKGDLVAAFTDTSGVESDNNLVSGISKVVNFLPKIALALPTLVTAEIGLVVRGLKNVVDGIKIVGSSAKDTAGSIISKSISGETSFVEILTTDTNAQTGNGLVDGISKVVNVITKIQLAPVALIASEINNIKDKLSTFFNAVSEAGTISDADKNTIEKAKNGDINPFSKDYWTVNTPLTGVAKGFNTLISMMNKVFNLPMALLTYINPLKLLEKGTDWITNKFGIDDSETKVKKEGSGSRLFGRGSNDHQVEGPNFISQVDPKYRNIPFNIAGDSQRQTLGDSGCAPAAAAMAINSTLGGASMLDSAQNALRYKAKDDGVRASYFEDEFARHGLRADYSYSSSVMRKQLMNNNKVVLMGQDRSNTSKSDSPFGPNPHYVTATGMSRDGQYVYINDPEASRPNIKYKASKVLGSSKLGIAAASGSKLISNKFRKYTARGTYGPETVQYKVWNALRAAGYNEIAVAAAMGNIQHESGFRVDAIEKGSGAGFGLIQWTGGRRTQIENYAAQKGVSASDLGLQLEFLLKELAQGSGQWTKADPRYGLGELSRNDWANGTDLSKATKAFMCCFERPSYDRSKNHIDRRLQSASEYYEAFTGTKVDMNLNLDTSSSYSGDTSSMSSSSSSSNSGGTILSKIISAFTGLAGAYGLTGSSNNDVYPMHSGEANTNYTGLTYNNTAQSAEGNVSSNPTHAKMQKKLVEQMYAIQGRLKYAQGNSKYPGSRNPEDGSGDCSSTVQWAYKKILGVDPGGWTGDQRTNTSTFTVRSGPDAAKDESWLQLGDLLLKNGHVEMYAGNNTMIGHGGGKDGQTPGPTIKKLDQSGKYDLVRRWVGFKGDNAASGSGLAYDNALHYVSGQGSDLPSIPYGIEPNKTSIDQYNSNTTITSAMPKYSNTTKSNNQQTSTMSNDIIVLIKTIVEMLKSVVTNTAHLNDIVKLLGDFVAASSEAAATGTPESKENAILAKQSFINAAQSLPGLNKPNLQLQRLIEDAERAAQC